jgi:hypothetical protein
MWYSDSSTMGFSSGLLQQFAQRENRDQDADAGNQHRKFNFDHGVLLVGNKLGDLGRPWVLVAGDRGHVVDRARTTVGFAKGAVWAQLATQAPGATKDVGVRIRFKPFATVLLGKLLRVFDLQTELVPVVEGVPDLLGSTVEIATAAEILELREHGGSP